MLNNKWNSRIVKLVVLLETLFSVPVDHRFEFDHVRRALMEVGCYFAGLEGRGGR